MADLRSLNLAVETVRDLDTPTFVLVCNAAKDLGVDPGWLARMCNRVLVAHPEAQIAITSPSSHRDGFSRLAISVRTDRGTAWKTIDFRDNRHWTVEALLAELGANTFERGTFSIAYYLWASPDEPIADPQGEATADEALAEIALTLAALS